MKLKSNHVMYRIFHFIIMRLLNKNKINKLLLKIPFLGFETDRLKEFFEN